jgi:hypothetical protein
VAHLPLLLSSCRDRVRPLSPTGSCHCRGNAAAPPPNPLPPRCCTTMESPTLRHHAQRIPLPSPVLLPLPPIHLVDQTTSGDRATAGAPRVVTVVQCVPSHAAGMGRTSRFDQGPGRAEAVGKYRPNAILIPFQFHFFNFQNFIQTSKICINL